MKTVFGLLLACGLALQAAGPVPRPAGALTIHEASGKETSLANQKGKVVVVQFLFTTCMHCQNTAGWLSKMQAELGPKGLQTYGIAFNDEVTTKDMPTNLKNLATFSQFAKFPVGFGTRDIVQKFLGFSVFEMTQFGVPQLVVIDKKGVIQAQTKPRPVKTDVIEESVMRALVTKLLAEK
jgi:peroxiredoxin